LQKTNRLETVDTKRCACLVSKANCWEKQMEKHVCSSN